MIIKKVKISDINPAPYNPRQDLKPADHEYQKLKKSIDEFDLVEPLILNKRNNVLIGGHQRLKILKERGDKDVDVSLVDLDEAKEKALNIALNRVQGEWDYDKLNLIFDELKGIDDFDIELTGFDIEDIKAGEFIPDTLTEQVDEEETKKKLSEKFIINPFSVFVAYSGVWATRKKYWVSLIQDKGETRKDLIGYSALCTNQYVYGTPGCKGESILDPVLAEVCLKWFNVNGGSSFDPFAGDSVFGYVSSYLGYQFEGIELRTEQAELNQKRLDDCGLKGTYHCDDAINIDKYIDDNSKDFLFTCPPYYDLEQYSDLKNDLSNMESYEEFNDKISKCIGKAVNKLKDDRFAVCVVGEIRNNIGGYQNFVSDTIKNFTQTGLIYYNEIVLSTSLGTAPVRANSYMKNRKIVKVHQNVLVFYKGNVDNIKTNFENIKIEEVLE